MKRRLFTIASTASLLLCLATAVLWVRSYWRSRWWVSGFAEVGGVHEIGYGRGRLYYVRSEDSFAAPHKDSGSDSLSSPEWLIDLAVPWSMREFRFSREEWQLGGFDVTLAAYPMVYVPFWFLFIVTGLTSAVSYRQALEGRLGDHCSRCGYNLTGNTSGVCPECAARVPGRNEMKT